MRILLKGSKKNKKENKGFTLVELIVVLVVLALLAAIIVPALLGYIDKAKSAKNMHLAAETRQATQALSDQMYAKNQVFKGMEVKCPGTVAYSQDQYRADLTSLVSYDFTKKVQYLYVAYKTVVKSEKDYKNQQEHKDAYTVIMMEIMFEGDDTIYTYFNNQWYTDVMIKIGGGDLSSKYGISGYTIVKYKNNNHDAVRGNVMPEKYKSANNITSLDGYTKPVY